MTSLAICFNSSTNLTYVTPSAALKMPDNLHVQKIHTQSHEQHSACYLHREEKSQTDLNHFAVLTHAHQVRVVLCFYHSGTSETMSDSPYSSTRLALRFKAHCMGTKTLMNKDMPQISTKHYCAS